MPGLDEKLGRNIAQNRFRMAIYVKIAFSFSTLVPRINVQKYLMEGRLIRLIDSNKLECFATK